MRSFFSLDRALEAARKPLPPLKVKRVVPMFTPTEKSKELAREAYAAKAVPQEKPHARCSKKNTRQLWSDCQPCAEKRIRRMAAMPAESHQGRLGRMLAETYGVEL